MRGSSFAMKGPSVVSLLLLIGCGSVLGKNFQCANDPTVPFPAFTSLLDLRIFMEAQFGDYTYSKGKSTPTLKYYLCPDTVFFPGVDKTSIFPYLNGTEILCGADGKSSNNCVLDGDDGLRQVLIRESEEKDYPLEVVKFHGITFKNAKTYSVYASGAPDTSVHFNDCHWVDNSGIAVIFNLYVPNADTDAVLTIDDKADMDGMDVSIVDSTISGSKLHPPPDYPDFKDFWGIASVGFVNLLNVTFAQNEGTEFVFNDGGGLLVYDCLFFKNYYSYSIRTTSSGYTFINETEFNANKIGVNVAVNDAVVEIEKSSFHGNHLDAEIAALGSEVSLKETCIRDLKSRASTTPVFVDSSSKLKASAHNYADNIHSKFCDTGVFVEDSNSKCAATNFKVDSCNFKCEEFDGTSCFIEDPTYLAVPMASEPEPETKSENKNDGLPAFVIVLIVAIASGAAAFGVVWWRRKREDARDGEFGDAGVEDEAGGGAEEDFENEPRRRGRSPTRRRPLDDDMHNIEIM